MKKVPVMLVIIFAMIALGTACFAGDKQGYVVKETFTFNSGDADSLEGRVYCAANDFVTGCSHMLESYIGGTHMDYAFQQVIPIECTPDLKDVPEGRAVCKGCLVVLTAPASTSGTFRVYTYCGRPNK